MATAKRILEARARLLSEGHLIKPGATVEDLRVFLSAVSLEEAEELVADLCTHEYLKYRPDGTFDIHPKLVEAIARALAH